MVSIGTLTSEILEEMTLQTGENLVAITQQTPVLLVFLRHFGCVFCKEAMTEIAQKRAEIEQGGVRIVFVHMSDEVTAKTYFNKFKLQGISFICDPNKKYYAAFGLMRGSFSQLFGLSTWIRGFQLTQRKGFEQESGQHLGDSFQMPGVFVLKNGIIREHYVHRLATDRPDYFQLASCCMI